MIQAARNVAIFVLAFPVALVASVHLYVPWHNALISGRSFTVVLEVFSGVPILSALFYFLVFTFVWAVPSGLLRTAKPYAWAACFGLAVSGVRELLTQHFILSPEPALAYAVIAVEALLDALGAALGCISSAVLVARLKQAAPNHSIKRTDQSLGD